ncbi:MAG TPA: glycosyltransferase family 2 protein [Rariglobus sp.]
MNTRILIVTPTLGESVFLDQTMASVEALPLDIAHVLSVPAAKVAALSARYPRAIVVADAGKAGGIYGAINAGLLAAPTAWDWFTYINDDDTLLPGFAQAALRHFAQAFPEPVFYGDVELIDEQGKRITRITTARSPSWIPALLQQGISPLMQQGMLFRRDVVERLAGFDLSYRLCADLDFWLRAYAGKNRFRYHPLCIAQFRLREGQLSGDTRVTMAEQDYIVARHLPHRTSSLDQWLTRVNYRLFNLPRYLARIRRRGFRTSYALLQPDTSRP